MYSKTGLLQNVLAYSFGWCTSCILLWHGHVSTVVIQASRNTAIQLTHPLHRPHRLVLGLNPADACATCPLLSSLQNSSIVPFPPSSRNFSSLCCISCCPSTSKPIITISSVPVFFLQPSHVQASALSQHVHLTSTVHFQHHPFFCNPYLLSNIYTLAASSWLHRAPNQSM